MPDSDDLKKIIEETDDTTRFELVAIWNKQDQIQDTYNSPFSVMSYEEYGEQMNELNSQIMELMKPKDAE